MFRMKWLRNKVQEDRNQIDVLLQMEVKQSHLDLKFLLSPQRIRLWLDQRLEQGEEELEGDPPAMVTAKQLY